MGGVDRDFLGDIVGRRALQPRGANQDQRLRAQVDVLLVLGRVAGDRLVAQLAELDAHLLGGHTVGAVPHHGPMAAARRGAVGDAGDALVLFEDAPERGRQLLERIQERAPARGRQHGDASS